MAGNLVLHFPYDPDARSFRGKMVFPDNLSHGRDARRRHLCADAYSALPVY